LIRGIKRKLGCEGRSLPEQPNLRLLRPPLGEVYSTGTWYTGVRGHGIHLDLLRLDGRIDLTDFERAEVYIELAFFFRGT
jgi:hypothetical protein